MEAPATPTPRRWPAIVALLLGSIGPPGILVALYIEDVRRHPWLTLACIAVWEIGVLVAGFVTQVWTRLQSKWVDRAADGLDRWVTSRVSRFRRKYLEWVFYQHRDFDVKGLTTQGTYNLELEQVFVDLAIEPRPAHAAAADPIRPVPPELAGRRQIWDYLESEAIQGHLALLGAPGSGKTTLLKKIALQMTGRKRPRIRQTIPILLFLREHAEAIRDNPAYSLADAVRSALARRQGPASPAGWFENQLEAGRCLVLLDGLDEVATVEVRQKVVAWVEAQMARWSRNQFLVTSRPHGYRTNPLAGVTVLEVQPFHREQIQRFVHNWYRANEIRASGKLDPGVEMKAREGAEDLLRRLGNSQTLIDLAVNPLLLTMIANVHRYRSSLPGRRVELYAEICEVFLGKRQQARGVEMDLTPAQKQRVLQPLAYHLMCTKRREIPLGEAVRITREPLRRVAGDRGKGAEEQFLKEVENTSGLLLERESQVYSLAHLAFQEYLAAVHAREQKLEADLIGKVADSWWHETLRLYGAQGDASPIVAACFGSDRPSVTALSLAIDCLEASREVELAWRAKVDSLVKEGVESSDPERFRLAAETLLARRLRDMEAVADALFVDPAYITHAEYQLFLDEKRAEGRYHQPDHWEVFRFPAGQALTPVVGMRSSDARAFCEWLTVRDNAFLYRLPQAGEFAQYGLEHRVTNGTHGVEGYWTDRRLHRVVAATLSTLSPADLRRRVEIDKEFARDRALDRVRDRALDRDLARHLALDRDRARDLARHLALARDRARDLDLDLDLDLERALDLDLALDRNRNRDRYRDRDRALDLDPDRARDRYLARALAHDLDLALDRARARDRDLARALDPDPDPALRKFYHIVRWMARIFTLSSAAALALAPPTGRRWPWRLGPRQPEPEASPESFLSLYIDLAILEARLEGQLPAVEGIRIVKERRL